MRQTLTFLMAFMLSLSWAFGQKVIYDQVGTNALGNFWVSSQGSGFQTYQALSADDVDVPAEGMTITGIEFIYSNNWFEGMKITIYENNAGLPGDIYENFTFTPSECVTEAVGVYTKVKVMFPYDVVLAEGKFWFSVAGTGYFFNGKWIFNDDENTIGAEAKYMALTDDFMGSVLPNPTWGDYTYPWGSSFDGTHFNLSFRLFTLPDDNDLGIKSISPVSGELTANQEITLAIQNDGLLTQTTYDVMYQVSTTIDGVLTEVESATETVTHDIARDEVYDYTFTKKVDMSDLTTYSIFAKVTLTGDDNSSNDVLSSSVKNYGPLYVLGIDREVYACGGIFVDPGSVVAPYTNDFTDTITFYPETPGNHISIDFTLMEIDSDVENFDFYDGASTDAPLLYQYVRYSGDYPSHIQARNADGAITVVVNVPFNYQGLYAGWEANIDCITPDSIDFMALSLSAGEPAEYILKGFATKVMAEITSSSADTVSRKVYLIENGSIVATETTETIIAGTIDTVLFDWTPSIVSENNSLRVMVENDPQATNDDNSFEITVPTYAKGSLLESFEGGIMPLEWISKTGESAIYPDYYNAIHGTGALSISKSDTIIMPLVQPSVVDKLVFDGYPSTAIKVLASKSANGPWELVGTTPISYSMSKYEFDLSNYAGEPYYFAFTLENQGQYSSAYIDNVRGGMLYHYDNDLMVTMLNGPVFIKNESEAHLSTTIYNVGVNDVMGKDYTVHIRTADSIYFTLKGVNLMHGEMADFSLYAMFATADTIDLYAEVMLEGETRIDNNMSSIYRAIVTDKFIGGGLDNGGTTNSVVVLYRKSSIAEMVYYPSEIGYYGDIYGVEFTYNFNYDAIDTVPVHVYLATMVDSFLVDTAVSLYTPSWIDSDSIQFTEVYNGYMDFENGTNLSMYIPFDSPVAYNGTDNILMMIVKDSSATVYKYPNFHTMDNDKSRFLNGYNSTNQIHTDNIVVQYGGNVNSYQMPLAQWHFANNDAPAFETMPVSTINEGDVYSYDIEIAYESPYDVTITADMLPEWLTLTAVSDTTATLTGTAVVGIFPIQLIASDGVYSATQSFDLHVNAVPNFTSTPVETLALGADYMYNAVVSYNGEGTVAISGGSANPSWLMVTDNGDNTATLTGMADAVGDYTITIEAVGEVSTEQVYTLTVDVMPVFDVMNDVVIKEGSDYNATVMVDDATVTITAGDNNSTNLTITDNGDGTATVSTMAMAVGEYNVHVIADNGNFTSELSYMITVGAVPVFTSAELVSVNNHEVYTYNVVVSYSGTDAVMINGDVPEWLTLTDNGDGTAVLTGTPDVSGEYVVSLIAVGEYFYETQTFSIFVDPNSIASADAAAFMVYPNPAKAYVTIEGMTNGTVEIYNITGALLISKGITSDSERISVSELRNGMYIISATNEYGTTSQRLVIE
jgi:hypothetical protein